ncbi:MAG: hypothetical protein ACD_46C00004G0005 [uncultured bacterium]|nr:MAG: hypothetical protein ACD_46C00004G0005 [uncultured bacterium]
MPRHFAETLTQGNQSMIKKILFATSLFTASLSIAQAGAFYIGPSINVIDVTSPNGSYRGLDPRISFGYSDIFSSSTYLAGEIFTTPFSAVLSENTSNSTSLKTSRNFGASFIPGVFISSDAIGYARLGLITTKFTGPSVYKTGAQFGVGLQAALAPNWSLRSEYDFITYGTISQLGSPKTDQFTIGVLYHFI